MCAGQLRELAPTGVMIGMHMRVDDMCDLNLGFRGLIDKPLLIACHHIHRHGLAEGATTEEVTRALIPWPTIV